MDTTITPADEGTDKMFRTLGEIKTALASKGNHFFSKDTMRFFSSRVSENVYPTRWGTFFVTSEQRDCEPRLYTVRFIAASKVTTPYISNDGVKVGDTPWERLELVETTSDAFQKYASRSDAHKAALRMQAQLSKGNS